jgi:heat shock protein HtpX
MSGVRTVMLMTFLTGLLVLAARLLNLGTTGMVVALLIGLALNFFNYWFSGPMVLKVYGAHLLEPGTPEMAQFGWLVEDVHALAAKAGLPPPKVALIPKEAPNAFATGRNPQNAVVAATVGLLRILDRRQVRAVMAHELGHVKNRDMLTMTLVAGAVSAISFFAMLARFGAMFGGHHGRDGERQGPNPIVLLVASILAPLIAMLVQFAISRAREYGADESGARISGDPLALASALERLHAAIPHAPPLSATGATAHMMIANPFSGRSLANLFSTHPDPASRIERLRAMTAAR